jgi:4'-phosphopantetheinyl transferase EntD
VCSDEELRRTAKLPGELWPTVIFSAKESLYKAWYPLMNCWLDYQEANIMIEPERGNFRAVITSRGSRALPWHSLEGRFAVTEKFIYTAIAIPEAAPATDR